jgi:TolB-like protein/Flp pilus assembly protein TadD
MVLPVLGAGPGVFNALVIVSVLGFPVAMGLAWTFDVTNQGIERTGPAAGISVPPPPDRWIRLKAALVGAGFVAVVWMGARAWRPLTEPLDTGVPVEEPTLAVLPLADYSPAGDQAYLADGLHEEILHHLAQLRGIRLTSRTSTLFFRGVPGEVAGDSLGARYVLEGSVRTAPDSILLTVQLIDALTDEHLWSEEMKRGFSLEGLLGLQRSLATKVATSLQGTLASDSEMARRAPPAQSLEAYNEFLRGVYYTNQVDTESWWRAKEHFERALQLDPEFGRGHAWLASTLGYLNNFSGGTQGEFFPQMTEHARLALQYAPEDPRAQMARIAYLWPQDFNWEEARRVIEFALELDPHNVDATWYLAEWYGVIAGDAERGLELIGQARRLDPYNPWISAVRAWILLNNGMLDEAAEEYRSQLAANPDDLDAAKGLIISLGLSGHQDEAGEIASEVLAKHSRPYPPDLSAYLASAGDTAGAREVLRSAIARKESGGSAAASGIALGYAVLGEVGEALNWLERSFLEEGGVYYLRRPGFATLAGEPRFQALWDQVGLYGEHPALAGERGTTK